MLKCRQTSTIQVTHVSSKQELWEYHSSLCTRCDKSTSGIWDGVQYQLITLHASCGTVYCNRYCLWLGGWVCVFGSVTTLTQNCVHQTGSAGKGGDYLQLIKSWPSCTPGKGVCGGAKFFGSALLQPARSVCVSLSAFFIWHRTTLVWNLLLAKCNYCHPTNSVKTSEGQTDNTNSGLTLRLQYSRIK